MNVTRSILSGVCIFDGPSNSGRAVAAVPEIFPEENCNPFSLSTIPDWEVVVARDEADVLTQTAKRVWLERSASLIEACLVAIDQDCEQILEEVDDNLKARVPPSELVSRLLIAPLAKSEDASQLTQMALSRGLGATAKVLEDVVDLQPLIRRFADNWRALGDSSFVGLTLSRHDVWRTLVERAIIRDVLEAHDWNEFQSVWNKLAFDQSTAAARSAIVRIGKELAARAFGRREVKDSLEELLDDNVVDAQFEEIATRKSNHIQYERALKQIRAIRDAVAQGQDARARLFLRELLAQQTADADLHNYAVKSLCNIAKRCAEMLRTDIEGECLQVALALAPNDSWTLIQLGDHYKRMREFDKALDTLRRATSEKEEMVLSSMADVYAARGDFDEAIALYKSIPHWSTIPEVRTAIADNYRRQGFFAEAAAQYDSLARDGFDSHRLLAGKAEIAKRQGMTNEAAAIYTELVKRADVDPISRRIYKLSYAGVLKQRGELDEAFVMVDAVIRETPFASDARVLRASILGLRDKSGEALSGLTDLGRNRLLREWVHHYYRGLLLLKLERFAEARAELEQNVKSASHAGDERALLGMAAALSLLMIDDVPRAATILNRIPPANDKYAEYVAEVLRFHVAVAQADNDRIKALSRSLHSNPPNVPELQIAVQHLIRREFASAKRLELDALLRIAA